MLVFLIHVRDPQFYALPAKTRAKNGRIRVMGFPPIGIMSLSSVLKQAGHECVMFDQANPDTPNEFIIQEITRRKPALVGLSFLSTTSYPYAKILARHIRATDSQVKLAFGEVFATLNAGLVKLQCPEVNFVCRGDGEQLLLDLLDHLDDPDAVGGLTWAKDGRVINNPNRSIERHLDQWPFPDRESLELDFVESMPLDVPAVLSMERFTTMQTSRGCPWPCVFCDIPIFNEGKWRARSPQHVVDDTRRRRVVARVSGYGQHIRPERIPCSSERLLPSPDNGHPGAGREELPGGGQPDPRRATDDQRRASAQVTHGSPPAAATCAPDDRKPRR